MKITFFRSPAEFHAWLESHHADAAELWVGFYKKSSGKPSITWPESVDAALCFGWIDGLRKNIDEIRYKIRFSPRKASSVWSAVNIKRFQALIEQGLVRPAGQKAFEARRENRSGVYSYEQRRAEFDEPYLGILKNNRAANDFFHRQPASYRKAACWWVISAKKEETRLKRLAQLIEDSAAGRRIAQFLRKPPPK
jgi:uncharacterized protein YdeI (YjbR/CyaY-like superfamily)